MSEDRKPFRLVIIEEVRIIKFQQGLTTQEIAEELRISRSFTGEILNGTKKAPSEVLKGLAKIAVSGNLAARKKRKDK